jgi:transposase
MHYVGVDLHKRFLVACAEDERGAHTASGRFDCQDQEEILRFFEKLVPFRAVIEASCSYRWFHDAVAPLGEVVLAHPLQLRAIVAGRAKTDKLDAALLARLLRAGLIPEAYIPPPEYRELRDIARARSRLSRQGTTAVNELHALLCRRNIRLPFSNLSSMSSRRWVAGLELGTVDGFLRDELIRRLAHYHEEVSKLDALLHEMAARFPQVEALTVLHGIGLYSALLIVGEIGEPSRFADGRQVGAYAGLTARVSQSGEHAYYGHISHQGSPWLRWILVEAAMKLVFKDRQLGNFYQRVRKRSGAKIARVAAARKLAVICWKRLMHWQRQQAA